VVKLLAGLTLRIAGRTTSHLPTAKRVGDTVTSTWPSTAAVVGTAGKAPSASRHLVERPHRSVVEPALFFATTCR
jgi:hypothetical protein